MNYSNYLMRSGNGEVVGKLNRVLIFYPGRQEQADRTDCRKIQEYAMASGYETVVSDDLNAIDRDRGLIAVLVAQNGNWEDAVARAGHLLLPVYVLGRPTLDLYVHIRRLVGTKPVAYGVIDHDQTGEELVGLLRLLETIVVTDTLPDALESNTANVVLIFKDSIATFPDLDAALEALGDNVPDAMAVSAELVNVSDIKRIRRDIRYKTMSIAVVGDNVQLQPDTELVTLADDYVEILDEMALSRIRSRAEKAKVLWAKANTDALTGCYTRSFLAEWMDEQSTAPAVAVLDLDDFKAINDTHGHIAGDKVLSEVGSFLRQAVRASDIVARWGGEEFVICFPHTHPSVASQIFEKILDKWNRKEHTQVKVTFSVGVADSLDNADKALYSAKKSGKNRVVCKTVSERPSLCICFGRQTDDIAMALQEAVSIVARSASLDELVIEERPDKFLFCGYNSLGWAESVQAFADLYPGSEMVVVFASKPSQEVREVLANCATTHVSTKFDQDALIYWLGLDDSIARSGSEEKGSTDDRLPEVESVESADDRIEPTGGEDHVPTKHDATERATIVGTRLPMFSLTEEPEEPEEPSGSKATEIPPPDERRRSGRSSWFALPKLGKAKMPHISTSDGLTSSVSLVAVWNPTGQHMTRAGLGLALGASRDTILANLNFASPELDYWFGVSHDGECTPADVGLVTMGDELTVDMVLPMVKRSRPMGIRYLAVGYKLGHIGVPELPQHILEAVLDELVREAELVVVSPCAQHDTSATVVALRSADMVVVPFATPQEIDLAKRQVSELSRAGVLDAAKVVELYWETGGAKSPKQCFDRRVQVRERMIGEGFSDDEVQAWQAVARELFAG